MDLWNGGMTEWWIGGMEEWRKGGLVELWNGRTVNDRMAERQKGGIS